MSNLSVSTVARQITDETGVTISPTAISSLFYRRKLDDDRCPIVNGMRLIPEEYVATIKSVLRQQGILPEEGLSS